MHCLPSCFSQAGLGRNIPASQSCTATMSGFDRMHVVPAPAKAKSTADEPVERRSRPTSKPSSSKLGLNAKTNEPPPPLAENSFEQVELLAFSRCLPKQRFLYSLRVLVWSSAVKQSVVWEIIECQSLMPHGSYARRDASMPSMEKGPVRADEHRSARHARGVHTRAKPTLLVVLKSLCAEVVLQACVACSVPESEIVGWSFASQAEPLATMQCNSFLQQPSAQGVLSKCGCISVAMGWLLPRLVFKPSESLPQAQRCRAARARPA